MPIKHVAALSLAGLLLVSTLAGCGKSTSNPAGDGPANQATEADNTPPVSNPRDAKAEHPTKLTVYSTPPGCLVLVNLVPVKNENDGLALTPCEIWVPSESISISVEKAGGKRSTQQVDARNARDLEFDVSSTPIELDDPSVWNAPLFEAAVGRPIPLESLNSTGRELDPFLSPDGRTIYFTSERSGLRGVYVATRPTPFHDFDAPAIVPDTSGADLPVSPSVSADGLTLIYAVAEKSRLWQLTRSDRDAPFGKKEITRADDEQQRAWRSAQLSADSLRLYWAEEGEADTVTRAAVRSERGKMFGKTLAFELPGHHPHLSADGLRQFQFDGTKLQRSRRGSTRQPFGPPEVVIELSLENYTVSPSHRQFWVTEDEQWMVYCDDVKSGDLYIVRLFDGPGWGRSFVGKSVADKTVAKTDMEEKPRPEATPTDTVDPRTLPLPYTTHWGKLVKLLETNKSDEAVTLVGQALSDPKLQADKELLDWDQELAQGLADFNAEVRRGLESLKPGAPIRVAGTRFEFVKADAETLHLKLKDKEVSKKLSDLSQGERIALAETGQDKAEGERALRYAIYLHFQGKLHQTVADGWFKRSGNLADTFHERLATRVLRQGQAELARGNTAAAITFLDAVPAAAGPETDAARQALQIRSTLYDTLVWNPTGPRKWQRGEMGEYIANAARANGSYLVSEKSYGDFELSCEWRVTEPNSMGGVFVRHSGQGKPLAKIHLANDSDLKKMDRYASGSLFGITSPDANVSLPAGSWNTLRIRVKGTEVNAWINDKPVLTATLPKEAPETGSVMLDGVAGGISYRKVLLFELVPAASEK